AGRARQRTRATGRARPSPAASARASSGSGRSTRRSRGTSRTRSTREPFAATNPTGRCAGSCDSLHGAPAAPALGSTLLEPTSRENMVLSPYDFIWFGFVMLNNPVFAKELEPAMEAGIEGL